MASVRLDQLRKVYENGFVAVHEVDLEIASGELVVLVGPSGCGKSTTLRMIAGLESISAGRLWIDERLVNDVPASRRDIAMVFQSYALYPHMTVFENLAFALKLRKLPRPEIEARVRVAAATLGLEQVLDRKPRHLSGGQRQRVALGRAIVRQPRVFLFDEPLSNLDARLRVQTRKEIARLHRQLGSTMIYVTHDQVEAMTLGDRIVVMNEGRVQQVGTPMELYERPANRFVAGFIGSPAMNFVEGEVRFEAGATLFRSDGGGIELTLPAEAVRMLEGVAGRDVVLGIRPEDLALVGVSSTAPRSGSDAGAGAALMLQVDVVEPLGSEVLLYASHAGQEIVARLAPQALPRAGDEVTLVVDLGKVHFFETDTGARVGGGASAEIPHRSD
jgi:multiple sugar transport system ATP-binding protein